MFINSYFRLYFPLHIEKNFTLKTVARNHLICTWITFYCRSVFTFYVYSFHQYHILFNHCGEFSLQFYFHSRMQHHFIFVIACNFPILYAFVFGMLTTSSFIYRSTFFTSPSHHSRSNLILNLASNVFILYLCALFIIFSLFFLLCCFSIVQHFINVIVSSPKWQCAPTPNCNNNLLVCKCVRCHVIRRPFPQHWWLLEGEYTRLSWLRPTSYCTKDQKKIKHDDRHRNECK